MARCKGDDHLCAIAARENLNEKIFGILARRGGKKVLEVLAANRTARSSAEGRHTLERRLRRDAGAAVHSKLRQIRAALAYGLH